jgi:tRNA-splicing endonuclease subunit Sen15
MAPSAIEQSRFSALDEALSSSKATFQDSTHPSHLLQLALTIVYSLQYQHDWTSLSVHTHSPLTNLQLPRPVVSGLPPRKAYIHPDEQVEILKAEHETGEHIEQHPEPEWVLPTHLGEKWSLADFAAVFDALDTVPSTDDDLEEDQVNVVGYRWRGRNRQKRLLLATLHDDSTVVYYIMHDGIVKPRQN